MHEDTDVADTDQMSKISFRPEHLCNNRKLANLEHNLQTKEVRMSMSHHTIVNHQHNRHSLRVAPQATEILEPQLPTTTLVIFIFSPEPPPRLPHPR
jgi:hypothetical protein